MIFLLNFVIIKHTVPIKDHYTCFLVGWDAWNRLCQDGNWNFYTKPHGQLCFKWVLKLIGPFFKEGLAQKKQELVELHPVCGDPPLKTVSKGPWTSECWFIKVPL